MSSGRDMMAVSFARIQKTESSASDSQQIWVGNIRVPVLVTAALATANSNRYEPRRDLRDNFFGVQPHTCDNARFGGTGTLRLERVVVGISLFRPQKPP